MFRATVVLSRIPRDGQTMNPTTPLDRQENRLNLTISGIREVVLIRYRV